MFKKKKILKIKKFEKITKTLMFLKKTFFLKKKNMHITRLAAICKITGSLKKTNKRSNTSRHITRIHRNSPHLKLWTIANW